MATTRQEQTDTFGLASHAGVIPVLVTGTDFAARTSAKRVAHAAPKAGSVAAA